MGRECRGVFNQCRGVFNQSCPAGEDAGSGTDDDVGDPRGVPVQQGDQGDMEDLSSVLNTLLVVAIIAALAPLIVALLPGPRMPQIVVLIIGGIAIGPQGFGLADPADLTLLSNIGL